MSLPLPPVGDDLADFPALVWRAQQPLSRIHRHTNCTVYFSADGSGRFDPPAGETGWGTCYLSTHPRGAFAEVFGRFRAITTRMLDDRVLASVYLASDARLADLTDPAVLGRWGLTGAMSAGTDVVYPVTQAWAARLHDAGYGGVYYAASHDPQLHSRSVALSGKPADPDTDPADTLNVSTQALRGPLVDDLAAGFGYVITGERPL